MNPLSLILKFAKGLAGNGEKVEEPLNILVVDDNASDLLFIEQIIKNRGHTCELAETLQLADVMLVARKGNYDGVLLDVSFDGTDKTGIEFFVKLKKLYKDLTVIFVTNGLSKPHIPNLPEGLIILVTKPKDVTDYELAIEFSIKIFAMVKQHQIAVNARLSNVSATMLLALIAAFLAGRFWPQISDVIDSFAK